NPQAHFIGKRFVGRHGTKSTGGACRREGGGRERLRASSLYVLRSSNDLECRDPARAWTKPHIYRNSTPVSAESAVSIGGGQQRLDSADRFFLDTARCFDTGSAFCRSPKCFTGRTLTKGRRRSIRTKSYLLAFRSRGRIAKPAAESHKHRNGCKTCQ